MALRTPLSVTPHLYMGDSTGRPLDMGTVYFGEQDKDPEFYPINLFSDDALTLPLAQPVHTKGGYLYDKGDMVEPHAKELIYSVKVLDSYGRKVFYKGAMMRNSWNDDVIQQINVAIIESQGAAVVAAEKAVSDAINNTAVEGGILADTFVTATANGLGGVARTQRDKNSDTLTPMDFGAKGNGVADDSANIQAAIYYSILNKNVLDGLNKTYKCNNVIFDSNLHFINAKLINNGNADLISVLTTVISRDWLENVTFDNIHIDGKRINQTAIKSTGTSEDGGRHGFRFRRPCRNIRIKNSSANYCAGDGICIYPDVYSGGNVLTSVIDFVIENSVFDWNRRHGGSSDRTDGMTWRNVKCKNNGLTLLGSEGAAIDSGAHGDSFNGNPYANGWDVEEYDDSTHSKNLLFENCEMTGNAKGGLIVLPTANCITPTSPTNIKVIGGRYDRGVHAAAGAWGVSISPNGLSNPNDVFENTIIDGVVTDDTVLLRNNKDYVVVNSNVTLNAVEKSSGYFDTNIKVLNQASNSENNTQLVLPVGKIKYNKTFNLMQVSGLPDYQINVDSYGAVEQKTYTHQGASKGKSVISVSDTNTIYRWQTSVSPVDTLRINDSGVSMRLTGDSKPANTLEMTFEAVTNTEIRVYMNGTDGVTRSGVIALT